MLLQERNYESHQLIEQRPLAASENLTDASSCSTISPPSSFNNRLHRSTFDLSSVNSLSTSSSDSRSSRLSSPTRNTSTLRYRGQSSSSSSSHYQDHPSLPEGAATPAVLHPAANIDTKSALQEIREEPRERTQSLDETQGENDLCTHKIAAAAAATIICSNDSPMSATATSNIASMHTNCMRSVTQYFLEVILLRYLVVPFLQLTIIIERYLRSICVFEDLQRNAGLVFASVFAHCSSFQQEPINFDGEELYSSSIAPLHQELSDNNDAFSCSSEAVCCYSSSFSSSDDDNTEREKDGWGHFADFQDELADESSFIPSCSASPLRTRAVAAVAVSPCCATTLETLAEVREEDNDAGEDWSF